MNDPRHERKGYPAPPVTLADLPKVPKGPAPGGRATAEPPLHLTLHSVLRSQAQCPHCDYRAPMDGADRIVAALDRLTAAVDRLNDATRGLSTFTPDCTKES